MPVQSNDGAGQPKPTPAPPAPKPTPAPKQPQPVGNAAQGGSIVIGGVNTGIPDTAANAAAIADAAVDSEGAPTGNAAEGGTIVIRGVDTGVPDTAANAEALAAAEAAPTPPAAPPPVAALDTTALSGADAVDELYNQAALHDIDPLAAAANALNEGAGGGIGDQGSAYGPWQIHLTDGRLGAFTGLPAYSPVAQSWAWSQAGFRYAFVSMRAGGAGGLTGAAAVHAIVYGFERPADEAYADTHRTTTYNELVRLGSGVRAQLAREFQGPSGSGGSVLSPPSVTQPPPKVVAVPPAGVSAAWDNLLELAATSIPRHAAAVNSLRDDLIGVFQGG